MRKNKYSMKIFFGFLAPLFIVLFFTACGSSKEYVSAWPAQEITIDGKNEDWQGGFQTFPLEKYSFGYKNDDKYLYLCYFTNDKSTIFDIIRFGMTFNFSSPKNHSKDYSIRFPVPDPGSLKEYLAQFKEDDLQKLAMDKLFQEYFNKQLHFSLIEKDYVSALSLKNNDGIEIKIGISSNTLVYELKVPLASTKSGYPIGSNAGEEINIKITTEEPKSAAKDALRNMPQMGGEIDDPMAGGRGDMRGGGRGGRGTQGGMGPGSNALKAARNSQTDKVITEFKLHLAKEKI